MKIAVSDILNREAQMFPGRLGVVTVDAHIELDKAIRREMLAKELDQGIVVGLLGRGIVFGVRYQSLDSRILRPVFHTAQPATTADDELDFGRVRQGEL